MREAILIPLLTMSLTACDRAPRDEGGSTESSREVGTPSASATASSKIDFATQIQPILQARCEHCHFAGGKMYQRLPFDRPETIKALATKLFSRIEDEKERRIIREFLSQP